MVSYDKYINNTSEQIIDIELEILKCGLFPYNKDKLSEYPEFLHKYCGRGIGIWQYPNQLSKYINFLLQKDIKSYLEIGVAAGGTFTFISNYLKQNGHLEISHAIDIAGCGQTYRGGSNLYTERFCKWIESTDSATFFQLGNFSESQLLPFYDVIMIDGDHSYDGVSSDFSNYQDKSNIFVFHDIVNSKTPGVSKFWLELKEKFPTYNFTEFVDQYFEDQSYMGIGVMEKT